MSCPNHLRARRAESEISFEALGMVAVPVAVKAENSRSCRGARPKEGGCGRNRAASTSFAGRRWKENREGVKKKLAKAWALLYKDSCAQVVELVDTLS